MSQFSLQGSVSVDTRRAIENVKNFKGELVQARDELARLGEAAAKDAGLKSIQSVAREKRKLIQAELQLIKEKARAEKDSIGSVSRANRKASTEANKLKREEARVAKEVASAKTRAEKQASADVAKAEKDARRQSLADEKEKLRQQMQLGERYAREIKAAWNRDGVTMNRFGEMKETVSKVLKDIEKNTRDIKLGFKYDPKGGDLEKIKAEILEARKAAAGVKVQLDTDKAKAEIEALLKPLADLKAAAKIEVSVDDKGAIKKAAITTGQGAGGGGPPGGGDSGDDESSALEATLEKIKAAREELWQKVSDASSLAGAGILGGLGIATKTATDFEAALRNVNSIAGLSEQKFDALNKSVLKLSSDPNVRQGPLDLADALYDIYSSGFAGQKALDILRQSALGAGAGLTDTKTAGAALMAVLNSNIKGVTNAKGAMDTLFQIVKSGVLSFEQLSSSIGQILPFAEPAGVSLQEIGAGIAVLTKQGQTASTAVGNMSNLIQKLANPSKSSADAFKALHIEYGYTALKAKGLTGILKDVAEKTGGQADAVKLLLPDMQSLSAALPLLANGSKDYSTALKEMSHAQDGVGEAQRTAAEQAKSTSAQIQKQAVAFETLRIQVGQKLLPGLNKLLERGNAVLGWFNALKPATQEGVVKWTTYAGVVLLLGGRIKSLIDTFILLKTALFTARIATAAETTATVANAGAATVATGATGRLAAAQLALAGAMARARAVGVAAMGALRIAIASVYGQIALIGIAIAGFTVGILGFRDAGVMTADQLIDKWGALGRIWVAGGDALGNLLTKLDPNNAKGDADARKFYELEKAGWIKNHKPVKTFDEWQDGRKAGQSASQAQSEEKARQEAARRRQQAVQAAKEAKRQKAELDRILKQIDDAQKKSSGSLSPEEKAARREENKRQAAAKREQLRLAREAAARAKDEAQQATDATRSFASSQSDALGDAANAWRDYGKTVEDVADKQIEKLRSTREGVASLVQSIESRLVESGAMSPKVAAGFYRQVGKLDQALSPALLQSIYDRSRRTSAQATLTAAGYDARKERLAGQDGAVEVRGAGNRAAGTMVAARGGELSIAQNLMDGMARGINTPRGLASCAAFSGALLNKLGISIQRNNVAAQLARNAEAMGARRIPISQASQGDLLVMHGSSEGAIKDSRGWGYHVGVSMGSGRMWDSSGNGPGHQRQGYAYTPKNGEAYALDTSVFSRFAGAGAVGTGASQGVSQPAARRPILLASRGAAATARGDATSALLRAYVAADAANDAASSKGSNAREFAALEAKFKALETLYKKRGLSIERLLRDIERAKGGQGKGGAAGAPATSAATAGVGGPPGAPTGDRPDFGRGLAKYSVSGLKSYFPVAKGDEYNANRRDVALALADLKPQLHTFAARKGLSGAAAQAWVKQQQQAIEALARYGDATTMATKDVERLLEAEQKRGDALRAGRAELNAQTANIANQLNGVLSGQSDEDLAKAIEAGERLAKRQQDLQAAGYSYDRALQLAKEEEQIRAVNAQYAELVSWLQKAQMTASDVAGVFDSYPSMVQMAGKMEDSLRAALATPKDDVDALREALSQVPSDLQNILDAATAAGAGGATLLAKYGPLADLLAKARAELDARDKTERARPEKEAQTERDGRLFEINRDLDSRTRMTRIFDEAGRARAQLRADLENQGGFSSAQINDILNRDAWISKTEKIGDALHGIFQNSFSNIEGGFGGMFSNILDGTRNWLTQMASEVLSSWVMNQVFGALIGGLGGAPATTAGSFGGGGVNLGGSSGGGFSLSNSIKAGGGLFGGAQGFYTGLTRVPRDGFPALLHRDESVLTARQAKEWRAMNLSTARGAQSSAGGGAAGGSGVQVIEQHFHAPVTIQANDTGEMQEKLAGSGNSLPRRETQRRARRALGA